MNKKGQTGQIGGLVGGIIGLVILVVIGFVTLDIITGSDLLTADSEFDNASDALVGNMTEGVGNVSTRLPTIFTIAAAVLLLGFVVFLVARARQTQQLQGGTI